jgi:hypothetical protein
VGRATLPAGVEVVLKVSAKVGDFAAEAAAVRTLSAAGLPVSNVRVLSDGPPSVIALDWTPGRAVDAGDGAQVRRQVVDLLGRVHALRADPPDDRLADPVKRIDGWCGYALKWWFRQDGSRAENVGRAEAWYQRVRPLIAGRSGSLVLLDGVPDHFLVGPDKQVRLIDVAELRPGDPVMDLAVLHLHAPGLLIGVLDQYRQAEVQDRHLAELLPFYVFLRALAAAEWSGSVLHDFEQGAVWLHRAATELDSATGRSRSEPT